MLILTRRAGESIHLGEDIIISVLSMKGKQVKLGIEVPEDLPVYREEVFKKIQQENEQAILACSQDFMAAADLWTRQNRKK
ncbi:carbon storage regulator, CsrA [Desulfonatronospira thiodismutans ASO3-1]|uniref:Translational regulator CsrA n=2 Tax=Desulfonatronospira TaxID=488937 RepID=D6SR80_9BACT|nr:carbon storage regulator CsrA [Desulfonatronospira thiodismutans]EFI33196.1 carbon storage regulator, CsrA [Desulfonatronospira thiodismutans ASO3-1]